LTTLTDEDGWLELRAFVEPLELPPGGDGRVIAEVAIPRGGHIEAHEPSEPFLIPTVLRVTSPGHLDVGPVEYPPPRERRLSWNPSPLLIYEGTIRIEAPIRIGREAAPGPLPVTAELRYQACTQTACMPPTSQSVQFAVEIRSGPRSS
jgi:hypothetical protein